MTVCVTGLLYRLPHLTHEEFTKIWDEHAKIINGLKIVKEKIIRYHQIQITQEHRDRLKELGVSPIPVDGIGQMFVETLDDFYALVADEEYQRLGIPDEARFLDKTPGKGGVIIGNLHLKFDSGKEGV